MLRFKKLVMKNFGPYKDVEELVFPEEGGVVIIRGQNGRGKTSILSALRFVLFGVVKLNGRKSVPLSQFVNQIGKEEGNYSYTVQLLVELNDIEYEITRQYTPKQGIHVPLSEADYQNPLLSIRHIKAKKVLPPDEAQLFLDQIMTDPVSRFYLFDGELLKQYENQLSEGEDTTAIQIRDSIERILGVPILKNAEYHVNIKYKDVERIYSKVLSANDQTTRLAKARVEAEKQRDEFQSDLEMTQIELDATLLELDEKNSLFEKYDADNKLNIEKTKCEDKVHELEGKKADIEEDLRESLESAWKCLLLPVLEENKAKLDSEIQEIEANIREINNRDKLIRELESSINHSTCQFCNQPLDRVALQKLQELLDEKKQDAKIDSLNTDRDRLKLIGEQAAYINKILGGGAVKHSIKTITKLDEERQRLTRDIILADADFDEALEKLKTHGSISGEDLKQLSKDITALTKKRDHQQEVIARAKVNLDKRLDTIRDIDNKLKEISKSSNLEAITEKREYLERVLSLIKASISCYQDKLRKDVEETATELFLELSSEKDYASLKISENYGLEIIRKDGSSVTLRSSGYEHLVAFALIGALHKNAPMRGPLFMDTSFGRLDSENSENLIKALPHLSEQVIILVHDREIDENTVNRLIPKSIKAKYSIDRTSSRESHLRREVDV